MRARWFPYLLVGLLALGLGGITAARGELRTFDATGYELVANQIRAGRGLRTSLLWLNESPLPALDAAGTIPFTLQPPGYPLTLAAAQVCAGPELGPRLLNLVCHLLSALLACAIASRCAGRLAGTLAGLAVAASCPLLLANRFAMSEALFTSCLLLTTYLLLRTREKQTLPWALLTGGAAALTISVRYAGVVFVGVFLVETLLRLRSGAGRRALAEGLLLATPGLATFLALRLRGTPWGQDTPRSPGEALHELATLAREGVESAHPIPLALAALLLPALILQRRGLLAELFRRGLDVVVVFGLGYGALLWIGLTRRLVVENRYAFPLVPLGVIVAASLLASARRAEPSGPRRLMLALVCAISLGLVGFYGLTGPSRFPSRPSPLEGFESYRYLQEHVPPGSRVLSNLPHLLSEDWVAYGLPQNTHNTSNRVPADLGAWLPGALRHCQARYVVVFTLPDRAQSPGWYPGADSLFAGRAASGELECVLSCPDGVVYRAE